MFRLVVSCLALGIALAEVLNKDILPVPYQDDIPILKPENSRAVQALPTGRYRIQSPNYPGPYPANSRITWSTVVGEQGQDIEITCDPFSVQSGRGCRFDYLSINGQRFCGTGKTPTVSATQLVISFRSNRRVQASGFQCILTVGAAPGTTTPAPAPPSPPPSSGDCRCGQRSGVRVVGGTEAQIGAFPWQAGLVQPGGTRTFCGGSVINNRYILTAAHCTAGSSASRIQVLLGDHRIGQNDAGEQRYSVVQIIDHPQYTSASGSGWDFSLLKLDREITFTSTISPVCLAEWGPTYAGVTATASGFGRLGATLDQATTLQQVDLPVWSEEDCKRRWGSTIKSSMICAGGKSSGGEGVCMGDSGGPLVTEVSGSFRLIGVVSFGQPCAIANSPDVFARVSVALDWIEMNTADATYCSAQDPRAYY